ncbi:MAG TPA: AIR synthase-related protein [Ohtaekwangia sp.]|nr:AIR synthase-related protein [Ohtaekwangia sp.]
MEAFPLAGKIQNNFFKSRVFPFCGKTRSEVIVGPEYGVDTSIVQLPNGLAIAMTSDPLSLIPTLGLQESAWLSVQLMANDMATTGFAPQYAQFVLTLPATLNAKDFQEYWQCIHRYCEQLGVAITGGHTGRFEGLNSTVSGGGTMITIASAEDMITSKGARAGDVVIMTQACAFISTSILALSFPETVKKFCGHEIHQQACDLFYKTSAVEAGLAAGEFGRLTRGVTAMHDVTEGGIIGALLEMAHASDCGFVIDETRIPIGDAQQRIGECFQIDPKYCIGAGAMVITAKVDKHELLLSHLHAKGIRATVIGTAVDASKGLILMNEKEERTVTDPGADPYWEAFFGAFNKGLR